MPEHNKRPLTKYLLDVFEEKKIEESDSNRC